MMTKQKKRKSENCKNSVSSNDEANSEKSTSLEHMSVMHFKSTTNKITWDHGTKKEVYEMEKHGHKSE